MCINSIGSIVMIFVTLETDNKGELISGIPMSIAPLTWGFIDLTMRNIALQHYTWAVFVKKLTMTAGTVEVN